MATDQQYDLSKVFDAALRKSTTVVGVCVPPELLSTCLGVLQECEKHMPVTNAAFEEDLQLCIAQLREHLK